VRSYLPSVADASRVTGFPVAWTPAGTVVVRAAGLRVQGVTVTAGGQVPSAGELAVFCRPVVTAPAVVRRDGTVLADAWLPDPVRLGELERHLGDGVIQDAVDAAALRRAIWSMTSTHVTASSSLHALAAAADAAARAALHTLNVPGRQRHSPRAQKARPNSPTPPPPSRPSPGNPRSPYSRPDSPSPRQHHNPRDRRNPPARGRGPWNRAPPRGDTRA